MDTRSTVEMRSIVIVDEDQSVFQTVFGAREAFSHPVLCCSSAEEFLNEYECRELECVLIDLDLPGMSGLQLMERLRRDGAETPIVFMGLRPTIRTVVEVMERGAVTFVEKPVVFNELIAAIQKALKFGDEHRRRTRHRDSARERLGRLTRKEREVFDLIVSGMTNKEMASRLNLSVRAVEDRRARLKRKLDAATPAEFGRLARDAQ